MRSERRTRSLETCECLPPCWRTAPARLQTRAEEMANAASHALACALPLMAWPALAVAAPRHNRALGTVVAGVLHHDGAGVPGLGPSATRCRTAAPSCGAGGGPRGDLLHRRQRHAPRWRRDDWLVGLGRHRHLRVVGCWRCRRRARLMRRLAAKTAPVHRPGTRCSAGVCRWLRCRASALIPRSPGCWPAARPHPSARPSSSSTAALRPLHLAPVREMARLPPAAALA